MIKIEIDLEPSLRYPYVPWTWALTLPSGTVHLGRGASPTEATARAAEVVTELLAPSDSGAVA